MMASIETPKGSSESGKESAAETLVSCLCITEGRSAFLPWLLWNFDRQSWPRRELVVIDSSPQPWEYPERGEIRVIRMPPGSGVAEKRNRALEEARGDIITWFDDDDWQHPCKAEWLVAAVKRGTTEAVVAGAYRGWFVDLRRRRCERYRSARREPVFNSAGFLRREVVDERFPCRLRRASDTPWLRSLLRKFRSRTVLVDSPLFFWLCHGDNLSNPVKRHRFPLNLEILRQEIGHDDWGDTDAQLDALEKRLALAPTAPTRTEKRLAPTPTEKRLAPAPAPLAPAPAPAPAEKRLAPTPTKKRLAPTPGPAEAAPAEKRLAPAPTEKRLAPMPTQPDAAEPFRPAVSAMIKATVLDAPYLDVMARHMLEQARYPFAETALVIDRPTQFRGKYHARPRAGEAELQRVVDGLVADQVVSRVIEVDPSRERVQAVYGRYFTGQIENLPTHAFTGGPIFATLFGLEQMQHDHVLQFDADVFFHCGARGWVETSLDHMARDPSLWLMMTHPGPPAGPPGASLGQRNIRLARWLEAHQLWRFQTATTRYFLCDRRRLRGRLRLRRAHGGCAPLEVLISNAMRRDGGYRGALGGTDSWHLHAWHHGEPFPAWAGRLAQTIVQGRFPDRQRGDYDLRLDQPAMRHSWASLLDSDAAMPNAEAATMPVAKAPVSAATPGIPRATPGSIKPQPSNASQASLAVVLPVRNRSGDMVQNALASLAWQHLGRPSQVLVVSLGSNAEHDERLAEDCSATGATLIRSGAAEEPWNKPLALNIGIRATLPDITHVMTMDADIILAEDLLAAAFEALEEDPRALILCRSLDLPRTAEVPRLAASLLSCFAKLQAQAKPRRRYGTGAIQLAARDFFFDVRGYDEDLRWWGAMDGDMVARAKAAGRAVRWIDDRTALLHQWHPRKHSILQRPDEVAAAQRAWRENHRLVRRRAGVVLRNPAGWGCQQENTPSQHRD